MRADDIRRIRLSLSMSQQRFAERLGVSITTVNRWERGRSNPSPLALTRLRRMQRKVVVE